MRNAEFSSIALDESSSNRLSEGQSGLFYLQKHPASGTYYSFAQGISPIGDKDEGFKAEFAKAKACTGALNDPVKALQAGEAEDRLSAAHVLVEKYRRVVAGRTKEVAIPDEETKLILKAILEADWGLDGRPEAGFNSAKPAPLLAYRLSLSAGSQGVPAVLTKPGESYTDKWKGAVKAWYEKEGAKFEIKKYVDEK